MAITYSGRRGTGRGSTSSSTLAISVSGVTVGSFLTVAFGCGGGKVASSVADDAGNTYTVDETNPSATDESASLARCVVASAPSTITVTLDAATSKRVAAVDEWSGIDTSSPLDLDGETNGTWGGGSATGAGITTTVSDTLILGLFAAFSYADGNTFGDSGSYTGIGYVASTSGVTDKGIGVCYRIVSATGTHTPVATVALGSQAFRAITAAYKAASGATHVSRNLLSGVG